MCCNVGGSFDEIAGAVVGSEVAVVASCNVGVGEIRGVIVVVTDAVLLP